MTKTFNGTLISMVIAALFLLMLFTSCNKEQKADMIIHNGTIYTMDEKNPIVEAVAVINGKIVYAGEYKNIQPYIGNETEHIDLQGKTMTPGFIESHGHFLGLGRSKMILDLTTVKSYDDLISIVADAVKKANPGEWICGRGWHQSKWEPQPAIMVRGFQTHDALSKVSPDNPVFLVHVSGHAGFANAKAMEIAGITSTTEISGDGEIIKESTGRPTGIFNENAMDLIRKCIPENNSELNKKAFYLATEECLKNGITSFGDAGCDRDGIAQYKELQKNGAMKIRIYAMLNGEDSTLINEYFLKGKEADSGNSFLTIRAVKLLADGALGSRGAWLLEPYSDRPGHYGNATVDMNYLYSTAQSCLKHQFQLCVHAIGDRANREVLNQYEKAFSENPADAKDSRFRIEHAQHISAQDIPRFAHLGVIPSMQAIHMSSDRPWAIDRLGIERIVEGAYVWKKLIESGAKVINGTDVPVEPINPIACFYASVTRRTLSGEPPEGFEPDQKMTRQQALRSYTLDAAFGMFEEKSKGSIEIDKVADFTVFSQDIMKVPDNEILKTTVDCTIINGKVEYKCKARN